MDFPIDQLDIKKDMIKKCSNNIVLRLIFVPDNDGLIPPECTSSSSQANVPPNVPSNVPSNQEQVHKNDTTLVNEIVLDEKQRVHI